jgi:hypothetical protein
MASPWKFLARLTLRRREWKEQGGKPEEDASTEPVEAATDNPPNSGDRLVAREPKPADQADAVMKVPEHSAQAGSSVQVKVDLESAKLVGAAGLPYPLMAISPPLQFTTRWHPRLPRRDRARSKSAARKPA